MSGSEGSGCLKSLVEVLVYAAILTYAMRIPNREAAQEVVQKEKERWPIVAFERQKWYVRSIESYDSFLSIIERISPDKLERWKLDPLEEGNRGSLAVVSLSSDAKELANCWIIIDREKMNYMRDKGNEKESEVIKRLCEGAVHGDIPRDAVDGGLLGAVKIVYADDGVLRMSQAEKDFRVNYVKGNWKREALSL